MAKLTLFQESQALGSYSIKNKYTSIGYHQDCDIVIDSPTVAAKQAVITKLSGYYRITTLVNDTPLIINHKETSTHFLSHGDTLRLGQYTLRFHESDTVVKFRERCSETEPEVDQSHEQLSALVDSLDVLPQSCLQIISGEHLGKTIPLQRSLLRLGQTGEQSAIIAHRSDGYYLTHLEGKLTPKVNGTDIADKSVMLTNGSTIQIGGIQMRFYEENDHSAAI